MIDLAFWCTVVFAVAVVLTIAVAVLARIAGYGLRVGWDRAGRDAERREKRRHADHMARLARAARPKPALLVDEDALRRELDIQRMAAGGW